MDPSFPRDPLTELDPDDALIAAWDAHRTMLVGLALRMRGNISDAEDAVQEAFLRLSRASLAEIDDVRAWLVVVVSRICLDQLRSANTRRVDLVAEPDVELSGVFAAESLGPDDRVTLDDNVRIAMLRVLERLSPAERVVFVLHDVFQFPFETVATIVGRTPAACRQLASRARTHVESEVSPARFSVDAAEQNRVAERFVAACAGADMDGLLQLLDPNVVGVAERFRFVRFRPIVGRAKVAARLIKLFGRDRRVTLVAMPVGADAGAIAFRDRRVVGVLTLSVHDGAIDHIHALLDPKQLAALAAALSSAT